MQLKAVRLVAEGEGEEARGGALFAQLQHAGSGTPVASFPGVKIGIQSKNTILLHRWAGIWMRVVCPGCGGAACLPAAPLYVFFDRHGSKGVASMQSRACVLLRVHCCPIKDLLLTARMCSSLKPPTLRLLPYPPTRSGPLPAGAQHTLPEFVAMCHEFPASDFDALHGGLDKLLASCRGRTAVTG